MAGELDEVRGRLLHATNTATAFAAVFGFLAARVGRVGRFPDPMLWPASVAEIAPIDVDLAVPAVAEFLRAAGVDRGVQAMLPTVPGERLVVAASTPERISLAETVLGDLDRALDLLLAKQHVSALRASIASQEALLQQTMDALFRDAGEVVRVLGELERRDAVMNTELHRALRFQRAMIEPLPVDERIVLDAIYLAADVISADFYDVAFLGEDHVRVFVADATGHGIAAGLATMFVKAEYEAHKRSRRTPPELIAGLNDVLTSRYETLDLRCTAICLDVHPSTRRMSFSSAAHPGPAIARAGGVELLPGGGSFIGLCSSLAFPEVEVILEPEDLVIAFTDGLLDASNASAKTFGADNLRRLASSFRREPRSFCPSVVSALADFVGEGRTLLDDVTVVALSLRSPGS